MLQEVKGALLLPSCPSKMRVAIMAQLRFTLYTVDEGKRPPVKWLENVPLPLTHLNAREAGLDSESQRSPSAGVLIDVWQIHQRGCLVIAESRQLLAGERFAISMGPLWKVVSSQDEQRGNAQSSRLSSRRGGRTF
jgi:hypothetical protein